MKATSGIAHDTYQTRNSKAVHSPVRSVPTFRPAAAVFGPTPLQTAAAVLTSARRALTTMEGFYARACALLSDTNHSKASLRRGRQSKAMSLVNRARADLRRARKALVVAEAAMLGFAGDLFQGMA